MQLKLRSDGAARLRDYSKDHVGEKLAVIVDHELLGAPVIRVPITGVELQIDALDSTQANAIVRMISPSTTK